MNDHDKLRALVEKWPQDRSPDPHTDPWTLGYLRAKKECADELEAALAALGAQPEAQGEAVAAMIVRDVAELPDRNSPEDAPEMMLVSADELHEIVQRHITAAPKPGEGVTDAMVEALESIRQFGADTLSGRVDGPADREWFKDGVREMTRRARLALTAAQQQGETADGR